MVMMMMLILSIIQWNHGMLWCSLGAGFAHVWRRPIQYVIIIIIIIIVILTRYLVRPHPALWRLVSGSSAVYQLLLVFLLFQVGLEYWRFDLLKLLPWILTSSCLDSRLIFISTFPRRDFQLIPCTPHNV